MGAVTNPPKVNDVKDVETMLDKWEEQSKTFKKDLDETFSDTIRIDRHRHSYDAAVDPGASGTAPRQPRKRPSPWQVSLPLRLRELSRRLMHPFL